ncbi:MAG: nitronate monooxygenase [Nitrospirae bacterium]|nr:nitronate monooxygenase [Nitrospirota bacterium]
MKPHQNSILPSLTIGKYTSKYPIIQGGMGIRISASKLSAAVANAGGIGVVSTVALGLDSPYYTKEKATSKDYFSANILALQDELKMARQLSPKGIIGVNCMVAISDYEQMVRTSAEFGAQIIFSGAGLPFGLPDYVSNYPDVALVPIISSVKAASIIIRKWERLHKRMPDGFVVETPNSAGGHLGAKPEEITDPDFRLEKVIPEVLSYLDKEAQLKIPVVGAGGIFNHQDILKIMGLGAHGVQLGSRFVCTDECDASDEFKELFMKAKKEDIVIVKSPVGMPGRAIRSEFTERFEKGLDVDDKCFAKCLKHCACRDNRETYCIASVLDKAQRGNIAEGLFFAG